MRHVDGGELHVAVFEKFLRDIPSLEQTAKLKRILEKVKELNPDLYDTVHSKIWQDYQKVARKYADKWLDDFSKSKVTTETINKEKNNG